MSYWHTLYNVRPQSKRREKEDKTNIIERTGLEEKELRKNEQFSYRLQERDKPYMGPLSAVFSLDERVDGRII